MRFSYQISSWIVRKELNPLQSPKRAQSLSLELRGGGGKKKPDDRDTNQFLTPQMIESYLAHAQKRREAIMKPST